MNPMFAMKKGTSMKSKKKRAAGAPSTGTYPEGSAPNDIGCASLGVTPGALHASILLRDSQIGGGGGFLQLTTAGGTNINSNIAPDFGIADFVATGLRGETPINDPISLSNPQMQPGVIRAVGSTSGDVELTFRMQVLNGSGTYNGGTVTVAIASQTGSGSINLLSPPSFPLSGNPPSGQAFAILSRPTNNDEVILEFRVTGNKKVGGPVTTSSVVPAGSALKNGSCYVKVIFN
mgnify:CR=1 FL=1